MSRATINVTPTPLKSLLRFAFPAFLVCTATPRTNITMHVPLMCNHHTYDSCIDTNKTFSGHAGITPLSLCTATFLVLEVEFVLLLQ
eukprot:m.51276 g.51276  ORF g.51276 m.51276 type:complete len:87 (+) comp11227_c0_seq7:185-445(+)